MLTRTDASRRVTLTLYGAPAGLVVDLVGQLEATSVPRPAPRARRRSATARAPRPARRTARTTPPAPRAAAGRAPGSPCSARSRARDSPCASCRVSHGCQARCSSRCSPVSSSLREREGDALAEALHPRRPRRRRPPGRPPRSRPSPHRLLVLAGQGVEQRDVRAHHQPVRREVRPAQGVEALLGGGVEDQAHDQGLHGRPLPAWPILCTWWRAGDERGPAAVARRGTASARCCSPTPAGRSTRRRTTASGRVPKGEHGPEEEPLAAARREYAEELGLPAPDGPPVPLGQVVLRSRKTVTAWAVRADPDLTGLRPRHLRPRVAAARRAARRRSPRSTGWPGSAWRRRRSKLHPRRSCRSWSGRACRDGVPLEGFHAVKHALRFAPALVTARRRRRPRPAPPRCAPGSLPTSPTPCSRAAVVGPVDHPTGVAGTARPDRSRTCAVLRRADRPARAARRARGTRATPARSSGSPRPPAPAGSPSPATSTPGRPPASAAAPGCTSPCPSWPSPPTTSPARCWCSTPTARTCAASPLPDDAVLVVGSERDGVGPVLRARADAVLSLPMRPGVSSLNLATAVAAVLYRWRLLQPRGRGGTRPEETAWQTRRQCSSSSGARSGSARPRRLAAGRPGADQHLRRRDRRPPVDPRRRRARQGRPLRRPDRPRLPVAVADPEARLRPHAPRRVLRRHQLRQQQGPLPAAGARGHPGAGDGRRWSTPSSTRSGS